MTPTKTCSSCGYASSEPTMPCTHPDAEVRDFAKRKPDECWVPRSDTEGEEAAE